MNSEIKIKNTADETQIDIEGTIGVPEEWQFDEPRERVATYEKFRNVVEQIAAIHSAKVVVNIRSTGGDVNDALLIHDALTQLKAHITTRCYGYTASAATIIAQAASEGSREISSNALYLIHNSICATEGNAEEMSQKIDLLRKTDERLAGIYSARSSRPEEEFRTLMAENNGNGRWLSPDEVLKAGLADRIIDEKPAPEPERKHTLKDSVRRGWEHLSNLMHPSPKEPLPEDRNVFHFDLMHQEEERHRYSATRTLPREDPSYGDPIRHANDAAYDADAQLFKH